MTAGARGAPARLAAGGLLLGAAWLALRSTAVQQADVRAGEALHRLGTPAVDRVVVATTDLGSVYAVLGIGTALAALGRPRVAADVVGVGCAGWLLSQGTKTGVRRARPYERDGARRLVRPPTGSSFPSGHACVATAWSTVVAEQAASPVGRSLLPGVGAYVALSRVHAGVHYPTDVLGGIGIGLVLSGLWRGPVAAAGRGLVGGTARLAAAIAAPAARLAWRVTRRVVCGR